MVVVARMTDRTVLASECLQKGLEVSFLAEAKTILGKLEDVYLQPEERQKIRSSNGAWFCTANEKHINFLVLADSAYPERHAYNLINEVRKELEGLPNYHMETDMAVQAFSRKNVAGLLVKYDDLESIDNLVATQSKMNKIKDIMSDSINQALDNRGMFESLDKKSEDLSSLATGFYKGSHDLHNKIRARNRRLMIYGGIAIVVVIILFFVTR